jgi:hypothetical protein
MLPLAAYNYVPPKAKLASQSVSTEEPEQRVFFFGWNNLTEFETAQITTLKGLFKENKIEIPDDFSDRALLKFI